jgi:hypothetical protein
MIYNHINLLFLLFNISLSPKLSNNLIDDIVKLFAKIFDPEKELHQ